MEKNTHSNLTDWMTAATGIGVFDFADNSMERRDYDGFQITRLTLENPKLCYAMTQSSGYRVVSMFDPLREPLRDIPLNVIERIAYNERESEEIVREIVAAFVRETGVVRMRVHVCKKLFQSNNRATVAVLVEEISDRV